MNSISFLYQPFRYCKSAFFSVGLICSLVTMKLNAQVYTFDFVSDQLSLTYSDCGIMNNDFMSCFGNINVENIVQVNPANMLFIDVEGGNCSPGCSGGDSGGDLMNFYETTDIDISAYSSVTLTANFSFIDYGDFGNPTSATCGTVPANLESGAGCGLDMLQFEYSTNGGTSWSFFDPGLTNVTDIGMGAGLSQSTNDCIVGSTIRVRIRFGTQSISEGILMEELEIFEATASINDPMLSGCVSNYSNYNLTAHNNTVNSNPGVTITWYDGDPNTGGTNLSPATNVNMNNVSNLWVEVTDGNCSASIAVTNNLTPNLVLSDPNIPAMCSADVICYDLTQHDLAVYNDPGAIVNWFDGNPNAGGTFIATPMCYNLNTIVDLWAQVILGTCSEVIDVNLTISPPDNATFTYPATICFNAPANPTPTIPPVVGGSFSIDGGATINATTGELAIFSTVPGNSYNITFTSSGACPSSFIQTITIIPPDDPSFGYPGIVCASGSNPTPTTFPSSPGNFSVNNGAVINALTGELELSSTIPGNMYAITFTTSGPCPGAFATGVILIEAPEDASFVYPTAACVGDLNNPTPTTFPLVPGSFTVNNGASINSSTGELDLSTTSSGTTYTITYTSSGSCPGTFTQLITINSGGDASFTFPGSVCENSSNPTPSTLPPSPGTFTINNGATININSGEVDLSSTFSGVTYTITFTTSGSCSATFDQFLLVNPVDDASFSYPATECINSSNPSPSVAPGSAGSFSVNNGATINPTTGELDLATTFAGVNYTITFTSSGSCPDAFDQNILITLADDASFTFPNSECINGSNPTPSTLPTPPGSFSVE